MRASVGGIGKALEAVQAIAMDVRAGRDMRVAERDDMFRPETLNHLHDDVSHAALGLPFAGRNYLGLSRGSAAFVTLTTDVDVIGLDHRAGTAVTWRGAQHVAIAALGHGVAQALQQIPGARV